MRRVEARVREYQGHAPLPRVELTQLVEVGLALGARGIAVEIETVPSKRAGVRVTLRPDDDTAAALQALLEDERRCSRVGTAGNKEEMQCSPVGTPGDAEREATALAVEPDRSVGAPRSREAALPEPPVAHCGQ